MNELATSAISGDLPKTDDLPVPADVRAHIKTRRTARLVEGMVAAGLTQENVAQLLEMSADTLQKYYRKELDTGVQKAVALASRSLYRRGMRGDTTALIFWLKARGKWRDREAMNVHVDVPAAVEAPKLDSRQVEDAIYVALARLRPTSIKAADAKLLIHKD